MTFPVSTVVTVPYCGSCGREPFGEWSETDLAADLICDSCGADLLAYGWTAGILTPTGVVLSEDDPGFGDVSVTFVANVGADTTDIQYRFDGGLWTFDDDVTSVYVISGAASGALVETQLRSVESGVAGPWGEVSSVTVATNATGATAGIAGTWTGGGLRPSADVAEMNTLAIVADPLTLWTVGQSVVTLDTNDAYWDGVDTWLVGTAPA
jgi:hypothetical protein